ncbi:hemerythrin domain-containing protein [Desulfosporosinus fructosivorans]|uniref:hemerythrin domain-containing protein n=1 Tax=Desulfosporosinus fructosivorans TaxID=2018669 RepID=UPI00130E1718|nr:hemerythrin domain-containing protein [Desulfosporosinus fructosivorans]
MDISNLNRQHNDIANLITEVEGYLSVKKVSVTASAFEVTMKIAKLAGLLKIHLKHEDEVLYPKLRTSNDLKVRQTTECFINEMGGLSSAFDEYRCLYKNSNYIKDNPDEFIRDTEAIIDALRKRVKKENEDLYLLAEQL